MARVYILQACCVVYQALCGIRLLDWTFVSIILSMVAVSFLEHFVALPTELRLLIYDHLFSCQPLDTFDIANLVSFSSIRRWDLLARKSYSILLVYGVLFDEAYDLVAKTHPLIFYNIQDLSALLKQRPSTLVNSISRLVFDFDSRHGKTIMRAIRLVGELPKLHSLEIRLPNTKGLYDIWLPHDRSYPVLKKLSVRVPDLERQQARERHEAELDELEV